MESVSNPDALLCEACGYPLARASDGPAGPCPECGAPPERSRPSRRIGTPWQRAPGLGSWVETSWRTMLRSRATFEVMAVGDRSRRGPVIVYLLIASALLVDPWVGVLIGDPARLAMRDGLAGWVRHGSVWIAEVLGGALVLLGLTWIERVGVEFFARRRRWRVTRAIARRVCDHASVGWIAAGAFPLLAMAVLDVAQNWFGVTPRGVVSLAPLGPPRVQVATLVSWSAVVGGFLAGMLVFESLVYVGVCACRFANAS